MTALMKVYNPFRVNFTHGQGVYLYDDQGNSYIDCISGIAVNAFGHNHPIMVQAVTEQLNKLWHVSNLYVTQPQADFAKMLCDKSFADVCFIGNSGTEAVEAALKTARSYYSSSGQFHRTRVITFSGSFHGRTHLCMTASGMKNDKGLGHIPDDFDVIAFGDHDALKAAIKPETAAIMIEPIQGEAGIKPVPVQCLEGLRKLCDEHDLLLIFDEIQCGAGRTGKLFAYEHTSITPDIMALAKGIGGGFPVGACLATNKAAKGMVVGMHGSTYGGNPLASTAGCTALSLLTEDGFMKHVRDIGQYTFEKFDKIKDRYQDLIVEVRGIGLMIGVEFKEKIVARDFVALCLMHGLAIGPAGNNTIRFMPPLIITKQEVDKALDIFVKLLAEL